MAFLIAYKNQQQKIINLKKLLVLGMIRKQNLASQLQIFNEISKQLILKHPLYNLANHIKKLNTNCHKLINVLSPICSFEQFHCAYQ